MELGKKMFRWVWDRFHGEQVMREATILILGSDEAAKARLFGLLTDEHQRNNLPITAAKFTFENIKFKALDLGDDQAVRRTLRDYPLQVDAVVYLMNDRRNVSRAGRELRNLLSYESLANVPFLVIVERNMILYEYHGRRAPHRALWMPFIKRYLVSRGGAAAGALWFHEEYDIDRVLRWLIDNIGRLPN